MKFLRPHGSLNVGALLPKSPGWLRASCKLITNRDGFCPGQFLCVASLGRSKRLGRLKRSSLSINKTRQSPDHACRAAGVAKPKLQVRLACRRRTLIHAARRPRAERSGSSVSQEVRASSIERRRLAGEGWSKFGRGLAVLQGRAVPGLLGLRQSCAARPAQEQ